MNFRGPCLQGVMGQVWERLVTRTMVMGEFVQGITLRQRGY